MKVMRRAAACVALIFMLGLITVTARATEETRHQLEEAEREKENTESMLEQTQENIDTLNEQKDSLQGTLTTLNTELSQVSTNLSDLEEKIAAKEAEIDEVSANIRQVQKELEEAIILKDDQYETMKQQIKFMYERSDYLYLELFFSSGSFSDFLNKNNYIEQLSAYQQKVLQDYKDAQALMESKEAELQRDMAQLEADKKELDDYKVQVVAEQSRV